MSKLDLKVNQGTGFGSSKYSLNLEIVNNDTSSVTVSAVRVVGYMWSQNRLFSTSWTTGVDNNGDIRLISNTTAPNYPGVGQTGIVNLTVSDYVYRVDHKLIDSTKLAPIVTLNIPSNNSYISPVSVTNRTDYSFDIVLTELPPNLGYSVTWFIPDTEEVYIGGTTALPTPSVQLTSATESVRVNSKKCDSKFVISWNSNEIIPASCGIVGAQVYIQPVTGAFFNSSRPESSWYSYPEISSSAVDNSYFILQEWDGLTWNDISEYNNYGIDIDSGIGPTTSNQLKLLPTASSGNDRGVYISTSSTFNPIWTDAENKDNLVIGSLGSNLGITRSLLKFEVSAIPSSATSIRNAVLRLNVNSTSGAWNYTNSNGHVSVNRVTTDWTENQATWTEAKTGISWNSVGGDFESTDHVWLGNTNLATNVTSGNTSGHFWVDVNVTDIVEYWRVNPSQNYGFLIKLTPSSQENLNSDICYYMNSSRLGSSGVPDGRPELLIAYNSQNANGPSPSVSISQPLNNSVIVGDIVNFVVNTSIAGGSVTQVALYYNSQNNESGFLGNASLVSTNVWSASIPFSVSGTSISVYAQAESDLGIFGFSDSVNLTFVNNPDVGIYTSGAICHTGSIDLVGAIDVSNSVYPIESYVTLSGVYLPTSAAVFACIEDRLNPGVMWFTGYGTGLWRYDPLAENKWTNYNTSNSPLPYNTLLAMVMKNDGNIFISCRVSDYVGGGLIRFNTNNWQTFTNSDWDFYDKSNSFLSSFGTIDIYSMTVDNNDDIWLGFTYEYSNQIVKFTGLNQNIPYTTTYTGTSSRGVRSVLCKNDKVFVGYSMTNIDMYSSATNSFVSLPSSVYENVRDMDLDINGNLYACFSNGLGFYNFTTSAWTNVDIANTPSWPNGLNSTTNHPQNRYCASVYIDGSNTKWFGFSTGNSKEYNGGVVTYTGSNFDLSAVSASSNWMVYDTTNNISLPSNNISTGLLKDTNGNIWVTTDKGVTRYNGTSWLSPNVNNFQAPITVNQDGSWTSTITPQFQNPLNLVATFIYANNVLNVPIEISASRLPILTRVSPSSDISIVNCTYTEVTPNITSATILGETYQTVGMPDGRLWMARNLAYVNGGIGQYWNNSSNDGDGAYYLNSDLLSLRDTLSASDWRIPTKDELEALRTELLIVSLLSAGGILKTSGTTFWDSPNAGADNSTGFDLHGAGYYSGYSSTWVYKKTVGNVVGLGSLDDLIYYLQLQYDDSSITNIIGPAVSLNDRFPLRLIYDPPFIQACQELFEITVSGTDFVHGDTATYVVEKSVSNSGPWYTLSAGTVTKNITIIDVVAPSESSWYKVKSYSSLGCSAESQKLLAYGNNKPISNISISNGPYNTTTPMIISGNFFDPDFGKVLVANQYTANDSVKSITLSADSVYIGTATFTKYQTTATSGDWKYIWNTPIVGTTNISGTIKDYFGETVLFSTALSSSIIEAPSITLLTPPTSGTFSSQNTTVNLSASVSSSNTITDVNFYISNGSTTIPLSYSSNVGDYWTKTINVSSTLSAFNNLGGEYNIYVSAVDSEGITNVSESHKLSANNLPTFVLTSPVGPVCHNGQITVYGNVFDDNGNNCTVNILSASSIITTATSVNGLFTWNWDSPPSGIHRLSAVVYDSLYPEDYSVTPFEIASGVTPQAIILNTFPAGLKNGVTVSPIINVVGESIELSASVISSESTSADFWFSDYNGTKQTLISANAPNKATITFQSSVNRLSYVLVDIYTIAGCSVQKLIPFYSMYPSVELDQFNSCSETIKLKGTLFFDGISGQNIYIDNNFVCKLYVSGAHIDDINLSRINDYYEFDYDWSNPISGTTELEFRCVNEYGNFSDFVTVPKIIPGSVYNTITPLTYVQQVSGIYIVSAASVQISSSLSIDDIDTISFIIETESGVNILRSNTESIVFSPAMNKLYNIKAMILVKSGCVIYSDYITIIRTNFVYGLNSVSLNGCANISTSVTGYMGKLNYLIGNYDSSATSNVINSESITGYVKDSFDANVYTVSADSLSANSSNNILGFNFDFLPTVGVSAVTLVTSSSVFGNFYSKKTMPTILPSITGIITSPTTATKYPVMTPLALSISATYLPSISMVKYYVDGYLVSQTSISPFNSTWTPTRTGTLRIHSVVVSTNGCSYETPSVYFNVTSMPLGIITSPANNSYIMSGTDYEITVLTSPSELGYVSAVDVYTNTDSLIGQAIQVNSNIWSIRNTNDISGVYAKIYDSVGLTAQTPTNTINIIVPTVSTLTTTSSSYDLNTAITFNISGSTPNPATIASIQLYSVVNNQYIYVNGTSGVVNIQASLFGAGTHTFVSKTTDSLGAYSYSPEVIVIVNSVSATSYPIITLISSDPVNRINQYGNITTSTFTISDYTYGILNDTIGSNAGTIKNVQSIDGLSKFQFDLEISASGNVTISGSNFINKSSSYVVNNYIFHCEGNRDINLTNYLPNHLTFGQDGTDSELLTLTSFFENYLNTIYTNLDSPCSIGVLEKTARLTNLHDPDKMELDYIQYFANYLGYNVDVNTSELGGFTINKESSAYSDGIDSTETFSEYQKKALRFVIRNLPNWYSIKTTRNSIKTLLLSFGLFGDLLEVYTNDYMNDWVINNIPPGTYVSNDMTTDRFPTPHMFVSIDFNNTDLGNIYGENQTLTSVYKSFETIRPANVVFEGLLGKYDTKLPDVYVDARCMLESSFIISKSVEISATPIPAP